MYKHTYAHPENRSVIQSLALMRWQPVARKQNNCGFRGYLLSVLKPDEAVRVCRVKLTVLLELETQAESVF